MFNSIELVAQYAGGASIPMTRKMMKMVGGKSQRAMTEAERTCTDQMNLLSIQMQTISY